MSKFGRALAGAAAGGAKAAGDVFAQKIKSNESQRKEKVLEKRQLALAKIANDYAVERDDVNYKRSETVRLDNRDYKDTTKRMDRLYAEGQTAEKRTYEEKADAKKAETKFGYDMDLQKERNKGYANKNLAAPKPDSTATKNYNQKQAAQKLNLKLSAYDPMQISESGDTAIKIEGKSQEEIDQILKDISSLGFEFDSTISKDKKEMTIVFGGFDNDKYKQNLNPATASKTEKVVDPKVAANDALYGALKKDPAAEKKIPLATPNAPGSNLNDQQGEFETLRGLGSSVGLAAPTTSSINPALPTDPAQWDVQNITQGGRSVAVVMTENGPIELTPEELAQYKKVSPNYGNEGLKGPAIDYFKKNLTGTQRIIK